MATQCTIGMSCTMSDGGVKRQRILCAECVRGFFGRITKITPITSDPPQAHGEVVAQPASIQRHKCL
jgi:hypothetical protein